MNDILGHGSADFWDRLVRSHVPISPSTDDDRIVLALECVLPDASSNAARERARRRIFHAESQGQNLPAPVAPATVNSVRIGRPALAGRTGRSWWLLAAAATLLLTLIGAGFWASGATSLWPWSQRHGDHIIPAVIDELGNVPMRGIDPGRTNVGPGPGIDRQPEIAWEYPVNGTIRTTPVVVDDVVFFGSSSDVPGETGRVLAVRSSDGSLIWSFLTQYTLSTAFLVDDGTLFAVDDGGTIYALNSQTGAQLWSVRLTDNDPFVFTWYGAPLMIDGKLVVSSGSPISVAASDESVFVARPPDLLIEGDPHVYAISPDDGRILWDAPGFPNLDVGLFALSLDDGSLMWSHAGTPAFLGPTYAGGTVFYGIHTPTRLIALDSATGEVRWETDVAVTDEWDGQGSPSLTTELVVAGTFSGAIVGIDRAGGDIRWTHNPLPLQPLNQVQSSVPIDGDVAVVVAWPAIAAFDIDDRAVLWTMPLTIDNWGAGPLAATNRMIFVTTVGSLDNDVLLALRSPPAPD